MLPFVYFYFFIGLKKVLDFFPQKIFYALLCILFVFNILSLPLKSHSYQNLPSPLKNFVSLHNWAKKNLPKEGVIISRKPTITYFYTDHKSINYPYTPNLKRIWEEVEKNNVEYIIVDEFSKETYYYLLPFLYKYKDNFRLLHKIGNTGILQVIDVRNKDK
jgi:hypothetical protein